MARHYRSPKLHTLFASGQALNYYKGATVATSEDDEIIMYIQKGYVKRQMISGAGTFSVQIIYGPQEIFSLTKIYKLLLGQDIYDGREVYYYQTLSDAQIYRLGANFLSHEVQADPTIYKELFAEAGQHLRGSVKNLENIGLTTTIARVSHQLVYFAKEFGCATDEGIKIQVPLTPQDLADLLSTDHETVAESISQLHSKKLLANRNQHFIITDMEGLMALAAD